MNCSVPILIYSDDVLIPEQHLISCQWKNELGHIPWAEFEFKDGDPALGDFELSSANLFDPGRVIRIVHRSREQDTELFKGSVIKQNVSARSAHFTLNVTCRHAAYKMTLSRNSRFHHNTILKSAEGQKEIETLKDEAVFEALLEPYELTLKVAEADREKVSAEHESLLQYDCSDWDFLQLRAEANGLMCYVKDQEILLHTPAIKGEGKPLHFGDNLLELDLDLDARNTTQKVHTTSWNVADQKTRTNASDDDPIETPGQKSAQELASEAGADTRYLWHMGDINEQEARNWSAAHHQRQSLSSIRGLAVTEGSITIEPGQTVQLKKIGDKWDGRAFVSAVSHSIESGVWLTQVHIGLDEQTHAEKFQIHTSPAANLTTGMSGVMLGTVLGYRISASGHELIEVNVFSSADDTGDDKRTLLARWTSSYAGQKGGLTMRPEPNDEVLLTFVNDDPRFPIIVGSLYNENAPRWETASDGAKQKEKGFYLNTEDDKGWEIYFSEDEKTLCVKSPNGQQLQVEDEGSSGGKISLEDTNSNQILMDSNGITISSDKAITLKSNQQDVVIESGQQTKTTWSAAQIVQQASNVNIEANLLAKVEGQFINLSTQ